MEHVIHPAAVRDRVRVHLVGVGGNGAQMVNCLARLDIAMRALGHPAGLHVTAFDDDTVSEANVGRQIYSRADIGLPKAVVAINRANHFFGLDWDALPARYEPARVRGYGNDPHLVIGCVDSARSRRELHNGLFAHGKGRCYWLDLGNTEGTGQVVLGEAVGWRLPQAEEWQRLPCVTELFPQLMSDAPDEDNTPSCSVRISLASQGLFVNDMVVRWAAQLLYELVSEGRLRQHGVVVNLRAKRAGPIEVDPAVWRRFGLKRRRPRGVR
jgi:PRTRC genetic system ThiF family protein